MSHRQSRFDGRVALRRWRVALALAAFAGAPGAHAQTPPVPTAPAAAASAPAVAPPPLPDARPVWEAFQKTGVKDSEVALLAQPLAPGVPLLISHNEKLSFTLASTTKVVTTLASLQVLPTNFRWRTRAWLTGVPADGRLAGDLVLVGGGDATLTSARLIDWFKRLHKQGLTEVRGQIVLDQSLFRLSIADHTNTPVPEAGNPHHARPDAFVVDDTSFDVSLRTGDGGALLARFDPPLGQVAIVNQLSGSARCAAQLRFEALPEPSAPAAGSAPDAARRSVQRVAARAPEAAPTPVPAAAAPASAASAPTDPAQPASDVPAPAAAPPPAATAAAAPPAAAPVPPVARVVVSGQWSPRCSNGLTMEAAPGRALSAALVAGAWEASGGQLTGRVQHRDAAAPSVRGARRVRTPASPYPGKPWATLDSAPLPELVRAINKDSNNLMARNLLLSMAPGFSPTTSTLQLARQRLTLWFKKSAAAVEAPRIDNGSGLSHNEQGSVLSMVQLLQGAWADSKVQKIFFASLPVAGADGTLAGRFKGSVAQRNAFLKTGTLNGVRSLAGYVRGKSGRMIAVAVVVNSERATAAVPAMDRFIEWVQQNG